MLFFHFSAVDLPVRNFCAGPKLKSRNPHQLSTDDACDAMAARLSLFLVGVLGRSSFHASILRLIIIFSCVSRYGATCNAQEQVRAVVEEHGHSDSAGVVLVSDEGGDEVKVAPTLRSEAVVMDDGAVVLPDESSENSYEQVQTQQQQQNLLDRVAKPDQQSSLAMTGSFPYLGSPPKTSDISTFQPLGGGRFDEYKNGESPYQISQDLQQKSDELARLRKPFIVEAMKHAWDGYKRHAFGHDELLPVSRKGADPWGGMGTTLVDSLDTLWMMGLSKEFYEGRDWVRDVSCLLSLLSCYCTPNEKLSTW